MMGNLNHKQILVIDDDSGLRSLFERFLGHFFNVTSKADGYQALTWLAGRKPDLVITDLDMPVLNGIQVLKILRTSLVYRDMKIIVVSGYDNNEYKNVCRDYGVLKYYVKPFNPVELLIYIYGIFHEPFVGNKKMEMLKSMA